MFMKLDQKVIDLLCCPLCKGKVIQNKEKGYFVCTICATQYPRRAVNVGDHEEEVYDFRIQRPSYCIPNWNDVWKDGQQDFESSHQKQSSRDGLKAYLAEIDSVSEIYSREFRIRGAVLDAGGHQGRLRHYLSAQEVHLYVSIDPFLCVFENIQRQPHLLESYPCLSESCNFLAARAEELPFISDSFDWVHMRSVVDHLEDPFKAFKEAYRVLRPEGNLLVGLAIKGKLRLSLRTRMRMKLESEGMTAVLKEVQGRFEGIFRGHKAKVKGRGPHIFRFTYAELKDLLSATRFDVNKEHWQKPPFNFCIYLSATAKKPIGW